MAIHTSITRTDFPSDGSQTRFAILFPCHDRSHLRVSLIDPAEPDQEVPLTEGVDYQAGELRPPEVGTWAVTLNVPPPAGWTVRVRRILPLTQPLSLRTQGRFSPGVIEDALDHLEMQIQQLNDGAITADTTVGGEINQAANVNTRGIGVYRSKLGEVLQFKGLEAGSGKIVVSEDASAATIAIDLGQVGPADVGAAPASHVGAGGNAHPIASLSQPGFMAPAHVQELDNHDSRLTALEKAEDGQVVRGTFTWTGSGWEGAGLQGLKDTADEVEGAARVRFVEPMGSTDYVVSVTARGDKEFRGASITAKAGEWVDISLYAAPDFERKPEIDFDIVIYPA